MKLIDIHISNDKVFSTLKCNSKVVVVIGNFDGLHKGHQKLLQIAKNEAVNRKLPFGIITFDPHPRDFFSNPKSNFLLIDFGSQSILKKILKKFQQKKIYVKSNYQDELKNCILVTCGKIMTMRKIISIIKRIVNK